MGKSHPVLIEVAWLPIIAKREDADNLKYFKT